MASRYEVEVTVAGADSLKNVNWRHGKLRPYAVVWIEPAGPGKFSTRVDDDGDTSPRWTENLIIPYANEAIIRDTILKVDIVHANADADTKPLIGSAKLPLRDVFDASGSRMERKVELHRPSGRPHGMIELRVAVRYVAPPPPNQAPSYGVPAYGAPPPYAAAPPAQSYAAPPTGYPSYGGAPPATVYGPAPVNAQPGFGCAPAAVYGADPGNAQPGFGGAPAAGYGAAAGNAEQKKKSNFGGLGAGLAMGAVAGALGGLALKEGFDRFEDKIAEDAAERVRHDNDCEYDDDDY